MTTTQTITGKARIINNALAYFFLANLLLYRITSRISILISKPTVPNYNTLGTPAATQEGTYGFNSQTLKLEINDGNTTKRLTFT